MKSLFSLLRLDFLPRHSDLALLVLRLWLGLSIALLHGRTKLFDFSAMSKKFPDLLGIGVTPSLALAVFAEFFCGLLLAVGLFTRFAALNLVVTMAVAFFLAHRSALTGEHSGELAFIYLAGFVALLVAGGGRFSVDAKLGPSRQSS